MRGKKNKIINKNKGPYEKQINSVTASGSCDGEKGS
jgi:hypothetical protein